MKKIKALLLGSMVFFLCLGIAYGGQKKIFGRQAENYIGSLAERAAAGTYSVYILERREVDVRTQARVDALVLNPAGTPFRALRRKDADHRIKMNSLKGGAGEKLTPDNASFFELIIKENKLNPYVLFDQEARELCIIYCAFIPPDLRWRRDKNGEVLLILRKLPRYHIFQTHFPENILMPRE